MVLFEIEQKFNWTLSNFNLLRQGMAPRGHRPFKIEHFKHQTFHDTYYDLKDTLSKNGLWVRERHSCNSVRQWEAKQLQTGSSWARSTYQESVDPHQIWEMIGTYIPNCPKADYKFGLNELCRFGTSRHSYVTNGRFTVVLDNTDFGHQVGEVEILAEDSNNAHADIDALFREYPWFFDTRTKPKGKLTAYFEHFGYPKQS